MTLLLAVMTTLTASAQTVPVGSVEVVGGPDCISVKGWAYDPSDEWENVIVYVTVYDDEECTNRVIGNRYSAELPTTGVAALEGIEGDHGFEGVFEWMSNGDYWVKFSVDTDDGLVPLSITPVHVKFLFCGHYVNASNVTDIFGDSSASFDNSTNTLTLNNPSGMEPSLGILIDADFDLTIKGSWHITQQQLNSWDSWDSDIVHAVRCSGSLTFDGDFTLLSETDHPTLLADGDITLRSGTLAVGSKDHYALQAGGNVVMESGFTRLELKNSMTAQSLTLPEGLSIVTPAGGTFDETLQTIVESDGTTPATHILIATENERGIEN